jgi:hypothetical protein
MSLSEFNTEESLMSRAISVPVSFEPEAWNLQGKYVSLGGSTYILTKLTIASDVRGVRPLRIVLTESGVPDGHDVTKIDHWVR